MSMPARPWLHVAAAALVAVAVVAGLALRLRDPLSDGVVPAEDPYTHMALVRGHLHDGSLDPLNERADLYPPGLHAIVATWWVATGVDLDVAFLVGPAVLGAVGILGVALLLWRNAGAAAAIVAPP
jgi:asparagine N-glycosylation enzyme membrane subunit Stt3